MQTTLDRPAESAAVPEWLAEAEVRAQLDFDRLSETGVTTQVIASYMGESMRPFVAEFAKAVRDNTEAVRLATAKEFASTEIARRAARLTEESRRLESSVEEYRATADKLRNQFTDAIAAGDSGKARSIRTRIDDAEAKAKVDDRLANDVGLQAEAAVNMAKAQLTQRIKAAESERITLASAERDAALTEISRLIASNLKALLLPRFIAPVWGLPLSNDVYAIAGLGD